VNDQEKVFSILSFSRSDLKGKGISDELIASLTDEDLEQIATGLRQSYTFEVPFDQALEVYATTFIVFKG